MNIITLVFVIYLNRVFVWFQEKQEREEEERKKRIQLYVFVLRAIAYTFNAKQSTDMTKRHLKVTKEGHEKMKSKVDVSSSPSSIPAQVDLIFRCVL